MLKHCPHCGQPIQPPRFQTYESRPNDFHSTAPAPIAGDWERTTPIGRLEIGDVTTALYDATASFGLVTITTAGAIGLLGGYIQIDAWRLDISYWAAPAWGATVALWRYFDGLKLAKGLLEIYESLITPEEPLPPKPEPQTVQVEIVNEKNNWKFEELKVEPRKLRNLVTTVLNGENFTERVATKKADLTQDEFKALREKFIGRGWAVWKHPTRKQQGVVLTVSGNALIRAIARTPLPRPPIVPDSGANGGADSKQQHAASKYDHIEV